MSQHSLSLAYLLAHLPTSWVESVSTLLSTPKIEAIFNQQQQFFTQFSATSSVLSIDDTISIGTAHELTTAQQVMLTHHLKQLMPWRKGPFNLFGNQIDTEWRSDWKWQRLFPHLNDLSQRRVLDIGCGSGYHLWRMLAQKPDYILGVDPSLLFLQQFLTVKGCYSDALPQLQFLPLGVQQLPAEAIFDTVFCMGVLYHRRNPTTFLADIHNFLVPGGQLILETLALEQQRPGLLIPKDRYAQMRNVWHIPHPDILCDWLIQAGYHDIQVVDAEYTSRQEQRATPWMENHSLQDFLDPNDHQKTIEGYPAPYRCIITAHA